MQSDATLCAHCGEPNGRSSIAVVISGETRTVCCGGCRAALNLIDPGAVSDPAAFAQWDQAQVLQQAEALPDGTRRLTLAIDAVHCPNCAWLLERTLAQLSPSAQISVEVPLRLAELRFDPNTLPLSTIVARLDALGYPVRLIDARNDQHSQRRDLKAVFVAGFGMMQAMMFAEPLYWQSADLPPQTAQFFAWISALITLPVVAYAGARFFTGARNELRLRQPAMDTLISAAILMAMIGSFVGLLHGASTVYFDAVAMFVFVLLLGRALESRLLARARTEAMRLQTRLPQRIERADGEWIALDAVQIGDALRAAPGSVLIADGTLKSLECWLSEALLDGEAAPKRIRQGEKVLAGASVHTGECIYLVEALGEATALATIARLSRRAAAARLPSANEQAQLATRFTLVILLLAIVTAAVWWVLAPDRALAVSLSVLTVACPCALGLALPLTRAMAHARLQRLNAVLLRPDALDRLSEVNTVLLDKTGTLTQLAHAAPIVRVSGTLDAAEAGAIAKALERNQSHPLARAFDGYADALEADALIALPGLGLRGVIGDETWTLGAPALFDLPDDGSVVLDGPRGCAWFQIDEQLRSGALAATNALRGLGLAVEIVSGDSHERVERVAQRLGIHTLASRQSPEQKRALVQAHHQAGRRVMMLGDGINDAIALAAADVAVTFGDATALAHTQADVMLLGNDLKALPALIETARRSSAIARQNLIWAWSYNLLAVPAAALGWVGPGWAAFGMALSSLLVTLNACRLLQRERLEHTRKEALPAS